MFSPHHPTDSVPVEKHLDDMDIDVSNLDLDPKAPDDMLAEVRQT